MCIRDRCRPIYEYTARPLSPFVCLGPPLCTLLPEKHGDAGVGHVATDRFPRLGDDEHFAVSQRHSDVALELHHDFTSSHHQSLYSEMIMLVIAVTLSTPPLSGLARCRMTADEELQS